MHKKVLDKGIPDDVMPGIKNKKVFSWNKIVGNIHVIHVSLFAF